MQVSVGVIRRWPIRLVIGWAIAASVAFGQPAAERTVKVTVTSPVLKGKSGAKLNVLVAASLGGMLRRMPIEATFDSQGQCKVDVPAGEYRFEVLHLDPPDTLIALKTASRKIQQDAVVELAALEPQAVEFALRDLPGVGLRELAIRSDAAIGELSWNAGSGGGSPRVVTSPTRRYRLRAMGESQSTHIAVWHEVPANNWLLQTSGAGIGTCRFRIRDDGPKYAKADAGFAFPDGKMEFPVNSETVLITNRCFMSCHFRMEMANGRRLVFCPQLGEIGKQKQITVGGPLTPIAWATVMPRKLVDKPETKHLVCGADLVDPQGYLVDKSESKIDWNVSVETPWGQVRRDVELTPAQVKLLRGPGRPVRVAVAYELEKPVSTTLTPVGFREYKALGFATSAPPHWGLQAVNYLAKVRRVFHSIEEYEMKPSKQRITVRWHNTSGTAWGGGHGITMPFRELADSFDHYESPWALTHEILHTFGYGHGERMKRATRAVEQKLRWFRWYMADHPELAPGPAIEPFLVFQHGSTFDDL